ncbi:MAG: class I SAM-dependent methyltransferase [Pseudomonadota bacterium]
MMRCRHCHAALGAPCLDLGTAPPSNNFLLLEQLSQPEVFYPLKLRVCENCWLLQTEDFSRSSELFTDDYVYFSSVSSSWLDHAKTYSKIAIDRLDLHASSHVIEIASNDGYLLKNFMAAGIPCLGIEPTASTAQAATEIGIPVLREFFNLNLGMSLASTGKHADLIIGNNVFAHVPDINDFTAGMACLLKESGSITLEFPHLLNLIGYNQFDTVYHEHYSYLSLGTVKRIFEKAGLRVYDIDVIPTHGGSLRVWGCHAAAAIATNESVHKMLDTESRAGLGTRATYNNLQDHAAAIKLAMLDFLLTQKRLGKKVAAYGAAAKGNTLLNYCGIKPDLLKVVFDAAQSKQGKFLPGSRIPVLAPAAMTSIRPDFLIVFPWNIYAEVKTQVEKTVDWPICLVRAIPDFSIDAPLNVSN